MNVRTGRQHRFTLVEIMVVISVSSVLVLLAIGMVHRVMRLESDYRRRAELQRTATRLSIQFRRDIHACRTVSIEPAPREPEGSDSDSGGLDPHARPILLRVVLPDKGQITYTANGPCVVRGLRGADGRNHREEYRFGPGHHVAVDRLSPARQDSPERIRLTIVQADEAGLVRPRVEVHLETVVGRLGRLRMESEAASLDDDYPADAPADAPAEGKPLSPEPSDTKTGETNV